jgi:hypothetical protein
VRGDLAAAFDRLEATRARVLRRLDGIDRDRLNRPSARGGWSVLQVLHHVTASEAASLEYVGKKMKAGESLPRAGMKSRLRLLALQLALASPLRLKAPAATAGVPPEIEPAELRARWDAVRAAWRERLEGFPVGIVDRTVLRHPYVGLLGLPDTLGFLQAHLEHHARQVDRLLAEHASRDAGAVGD